MSSQQPTNQTGSDVRTLGAMAGIVKLEVSLGWPPPYSLPGPRTDHLPCYAFPSRSRSVGSSMKTSERSRSSVSSPLIRSWTLDRSTRPDSLLATRTDASLTRPSAFPPSTRLFGCLSLTLTFLSRRFGRIFTKPFRLPGSGPNGAPLQTQFRASPPPIRNRPTGRGGKRPFAVFYWIVGRPGTSHTCVTNFPSAAYRPTVMMVLFLFDSSSRGARPGPSADLPAGERSWVG